MKLRTILFAALCSLAPWPTAGQERPYVLDGLVVTASPTPRAAQAVGRSVTVLDGDDLRARGVTRVSDALREVEGLFVVEGGSFGAATSVFMRGGESDFVQVLVDGVQVNQPGGAFDFAGLTLGNVERIEVLRGPASSLYGSDAMAGVIHVITRTGRGRPSLALSVRGGSFQRREVSATASGGGPGVGWSFGAEHFETAGILPFNNAHRNSGITGSVRLAPDAATRASVAFRVADRRFAFPTDGTGQVVDRNAFTFGDEASLALTGARRLSDRVQVRGNVTLARTAGGTDDRADSPADTLGFFGFTSLDRVQRVVADLRAHVGVGGAIATVGFEVEDQSQRSISESASQWGLTPGSSDYQRGNRAGYLHATGIHGGISYGLGARLEDNDRFGRSGSWNAEVAWQATSITRVRASAGSALKEPTFYENYAQGYVRGNPDLEPERARSWEVGVEQRLAEGRGSVRLTWFSQRFRDLIEYTSLPAQPTDPNYLNVAGALARGVELGGELRLGDLGLSADWSWLDTRVLDGGPDGAGGSFVEGQPLLRRPSHRVDLRAATAVGAARVSGGVRIVGRREDRDFSTYPAERALLPRYTTVALGTAVPVGTRWVLSLRGENLLDARYEEVLGFPAPGRGVYVGVRVALGGPDLP